MSTTYAPKTQFKATAHRAGATGVQAIVTATITPLILDTEDSDPGNNYNPATGEFTVPVAGNYNCQINTQITSGASDIASIVYIVYAYKNATNFSQLARWSNPVNSLVAVNGLSGGIVIPCVAGDVLTFRAFHNAGANRNFGGTSDNLMVGSFSLVP